MAALTQSTFYSNPGLATITVNTLSSSDTLTYTSGAKQIVILYNSTVGSLTATFVGSTSTTISPTGYGKTVDVSAGFAATVAAGACKAVNLDNIAVWLSGNVTVTGGPAITAFILN